MPLFLLFLAQTDPTGELFNGGANDTQRNITRGLESAGVPHSIAVWLGHGYTAVFIVVMALVLLKVFWQRIRNRKAKKRPARRGRRR